LARLREELADEGIPLDLDSPGALALLEELDYARRPHTHEGVSPRFGAILAADRDLDGDALGLPAVIDRTTLTAAAIRPLADGRSSFLARHRAGHALVSFDRTIEHESTAVQVATEAGVTVVQRQPTGWVRVFDRRGVITWDGSRWWSKPLAGNLAETIRSGLQTELPPVLDCLAEFCVHWLSPNRVGAVLVWEVGDAVDFDQHLSMATGAEVLPLHFTERLHFAAALNMLSQTDRAALVDREGVLRRVGVALRPSDTARAHVPPHKGTRHTSALRSSYDEPNTVIFTVSASGPVTVMQAGRIVCVASTNPFAGVDA
jgi:hypothetical protein